jgi:hypothetical protein
MTRYVAPAHVSSVFLSCGECAVVDGVVELPDDLSEGDLIGLAANGFMAVLDEAATPASKGAKRVSTEPVPSDAAGDVEGLDTNGGGVSEVGQA